MIMRTSVRASPMMLAAASRLEGEAARSRAMICALSIIALTGFFRSCTRNAVRRSL
jgi:hypothetical protein